MNKLPQVTNWRALLLLAMCFLCAAPLLHAERHKVIAEQPQSKTIKGTVKDTKGEAVIGATVMLKGTTVGVATDVKGEFQLLCPDENAVLLVSFIGYDTKEVAVKGKTDFNIVLSESTTELGEVQVIAYGTQKKVTVTGAISSISGDELSKSPVASLANALTGKVSGFTSVQYSGEPGADDPDIFVRGIGTLSTSGSTPLILVDGVERSFFQIDPNEVESVTLLKDASATAVFGVRGANGVILVTTKRGKEGKAKVTASTSYAINFPTRMRKMASALQWIEYSQDAIRRDNADKSEDEIQMLIDASNYPTSLLETYQDPNRNPLLYPDMDWMDYLMKKSTLQTQHNVNISGGTERVRYFVSIGMMTQDGMFKTFESPNDKAEGNYKYNRYNYRTNLDFDLTKTTLLSVNIGGRVEDKTQPNPALNRDASMNELFKRIYRASPMAGAGIVDGKWIKANSDYIKDPGEDPLEEYYGRGHFTFVKNVLEADFALSQKLDVFTKGLSVKVKGAYNTEYTHTKKWQVPNNGTTVASYMPILQQDSTVVYRRTGAPGDIGFAKEWGAGRNWYAEASLNYARNFEAHHVSALFLYNQSRTYYPSSYREIPTGYVGLVGRVTYDYNNKYLLDFNIGYNGSENFAPGKRFGVFPAVSAGWVLSSEKFMASQQLISHLKLRLSYGVVGNDKLNGTSNRFLYQDNTYSLGGGIYNFGTNNITVNGASEGKIGNPDLKWEKAYKQNYGVDVNFLEDRLKLTFDYFKDKRKDILVTVNAAVPGYVGMSSGVRPALNLGKVNNQGFEITARWEDQAGESFRYWVDANLSYAKNKIIYQDEYIMDQPYMQRTGHSVGQPFGRLFYGFYDVGTEERYEKELGTPFPDHFTDLQPGDCVYVDLNKDGMIDDNDETAIGYPDQPRYTGGITLGFQWKNFDFQMLWSGAFKASRILNESLRRPLAEGTGLMEFQFTDRWTEDNKGASLPRATGSGSSANNYTPSSEVWLKDAKYLRLKNIELGYNIHFSKYISNLRIFANGYNLLTFDKLSAFNIDPESWTGSDRFKYPVNRTVNLGVKVSF